MLYKKAIFLGGNLDALNAPVFFHNIIKDQQIKMRDNVFAETVSQIKTASNKLAIIDRNGDNPDFDLEAEIRNHPDSLFVKCFAIKANEMNDNGDYFPRGELKIATPTFVGVPVFTNHQNQDINQARGKVVYSWWDDERDGIMIIARVDAEAYPQLARGIKEQYIMGTSMGCNVKHSVCSICHNYAESPDQFCSHIKERKTRTIEAKNQKCEYHKHGSEEECPVCGCKEGETKKHDVAHKAFEYNYGIKFIENSFVVNPACHTCGVTEVIDPKEFLNKVSEIEHRLPVLLKAASTAKLMCTDKTCIPLISSAQIANINNAIEFLHENTPKIIKVAGQKEISDLNQALTILTNVSQAMLQQRDQLDLEFLTDLVTVLQGLQEVTDELTQQGYGRIASPTGEAGAPSPTTTPPASGQPEASAAAPAAPAAPVNPTPGGGSKIMTGTAGPGTVTSPAASKRIDFSKIAKIIESNRKVAPRLVLRKETKVLAPKFFINIKK